MVTESDTIPSWVFLNACGLVFVLTSIVKEVDHTLTLHGSFAILVIYSRVLNEIEEAFFGKKHSERP